MEGDRNIRIRADNIVRVRRVQIAIKCLIGVVYRIPWALALVRLLRRESLTHGDKEASGWSLDTVETYRNGLADVGSAFQGLHVMEIGTGDNLAVPLAMLAAGAERITTIDRRDHRLPEKLNAPLYREVAARLSAGAEIAASLERIEFTVCRAEALPSQWRERFDLVVSNSVIEHVADIGAVFREIQATLKLGGITVHRIDLTSHGHMRSESDPLEFLMYPQWAWRLTSRPGSINRMRYTEIVALVEKTGLEIAVVKPLQTLPESHVLRLQPHLAKPFREMSAESLRVLSFLLVARKKS